MGVPQSKKNTLLNKFQKDIATTYLYLLRDIQRQTQHNSVVQVLQVFLNINITFESLENGNNFHEINRA